MSKRNRKRHRSGKAGRVPAQNKALPRRRWQSFKLITATLVLVLVGLLLLRVGGNSSPPQMDIATSALHEEEYLVPPPPPPGYYSSAPPTGPYDRYSRSQMREWLLELLDQHPEREFAMRLKGYLVTHTAEVDFQSVAIDWIRRGEAGYGLGRLDMGIHPPVPILMLDTIIFDRQYTTVQQVFRVISHEGYHLDQVMQGAVPKEIITETGGRLFTQEDIRILYLGEVEAFRRECELSHGKPDYRNISVDEFCDDYERHGIIALRLWVAKMYTAYVPVYQRHREYVFRLAKDPAAR